MITTATRPRTRKSDISRAVARVLGHDSRSAAHGWDVYDDGVRVIITLNYTLRQTDRRAFEELQDSPLARRYRLHYTPALLGDDYEHMPADYEGCGVIDLTRREEPQAPATTTQETPAMPATDFPTHYTATGPNGRPLTRGAEVSENGRVASFVRVASATEIMVEWSWLNRREIITADRVGAKITAHGPQESREILTHDSDARCEEQQAAATPVTVEWTHTVRGHHNGTATVNGRTYRITHISHADRTRGALGDHLAHTPDDDGRMGPPVARTWGLADLLGALADHAGATPGPLALTETGRQHPTRR